MVPDPMIGLEGVALDRAVAVALGVIVTETPRGPVIQNANGTDTRWCPSIDFAQGAGIVQRERVAVMPLEDGTWYAEVGITYLDKLPVGFEGNGAGTTMLLAAMRALVDAHLQGRTSVTESEALPVDVNLDAPPSDTAS